MVSAQQLVLLVFWATPWTVSLTWSSSISNVLNIPSIRPDVREEKTYFIKTIERGTEMAMKHCQDVFKWDRWNCPKSAFHRNGKQLLTRENAYARAIAVAGIVHSIIANCSQGSFKGCRSCQARFQGKTQTFPVGSEKVDPIVYLEMFKKRIDSDRMQENCADNTAYAEKIASAFLDGSRHPQNDAIEYANMHNDFVGKNIVRETMQKRCRCHGVSGSCNLETCWMQARPFEEVAGLLRKRYDNARRVTVSLGNAASKRNVAQEVQRTNPRELVYIDESPNYCYPNDATGWPGTQKRRCSRAKRNATRNPLERESCRTLCKSCGYRVRRQSREITRMCNCRLKPCCEVICEKCTEKVNEHFCS